MFTFYSVQAKEAINAYPEWTRRIAVYFLPEVKRLWEFRKKGRKLLRRILDAQIAKEGYGKIHREDTEDEQGTFISWLLKNTTEHERSDPLVLANNQMACKLSN
jgi:hypothetical protein